MTTVATVRTPSGAERRGGLLGVAVEILQDRLDGAHDEGQADEDERDEDAPRRIGDPQSERCCERADPAVRRIERGKRDAGDGGGQCKGQVDEGIEQPAPGKAIAHQHPGDEEPEDGIDAGRGERQAEGDAERRQRAAAGGDGEELGPAEARGLEDEAGKRDQNDQAQISERQAERQAEAGDDARLAERQGHDVAHARTSPPLEDLVEGAALAEMFALRLGPAAEERIVDVDELQGGEAFKVLRIGGSRDWRGR